MPDPISEVKTAALAVEQTAGRGLRAWGAQHWRWGWYAFAAAALVAVIGWVR